ncbi:MAG: hypothetical protein ACLUW6_08045 [Coriobacteriaceae bacterium]
MANKPTTHPAVGSSTVRPAKAPTAQKTMANTNRWSTRVLVTIALLCAISVLLSFVEFPLLPGVAWLSYDASIMPAAVCASPLARRPVSPAASSRWWPTASCSPTSPARS